MKKLRVSDHALVCLLERAGGFEIEAFRECVAASLERAAKAANSINETEYTISADGMRYVIRHGVLVTVEPMTIGRSEMKERA